jgi:hypothetical protein
MRQVASIYLSKRRFIPEARTIDNYCYQTLRLKYKFMYVFSSGCKKKKKKEKGRRYPWKRPCRAIEL